MVLYRLYVLYEVYFYLYNSTNRNILHKVHTIDYCLPEGTPLDLTLRIKFTAEPAANESPSGLASP